MALGEMQEAALWCGRRLEPGHLDRLAKVCSRCAVRYPPAALAIPTWLTGTAWLGTPRQWGSAAVSSTLLRPQRAVADSAR